MPTNIVRNIPAPFEVTPTPTLLSPTVYYFSEFTAGRLPLKDINYKEIEPPSDLPGYAIANSQDFYLTPNPQYVISLFLNLPSVFFSEFDNYHQITTIDVLRLDLIAYRYYVNVEYWWVIALANNILDPFNLEIGQILRIPAEHTLINEWVQRPVKKVRDPNAFFFGTV
jgi:hypothetical protein